MADETLTLALHGEISLEAFTEAIVHWRGLVDVLTREVASDGDVRWVIDELSAGSATATIRAVGSPASPVVDAYVEVGEALAEGTIRTLFEPVREEAVALSGILDGEVEFIRFETASRDLMIAKNYEVAITLDAIFKPPPALPAALGGVQGRIQTLTSRGTLRFTLYDALHDRAVSCYLAEGQEENMRDVWGQTATVEGVVTRDPISGRPLNVRNVRNVSPVRQVDRDAYLKARGAVKRDEEDAREPEELITAARDG